MPPRSLAAPARPSRAPAAPPDADPLHAAALAYQEFHQQGDPADPERLDSWCESYRGGGDAHARLFRDVARSDPGEALRVASGVATMPAAGDDFIGFRLVTELGRGAFGRVFLAQQGDLADRPVALKVSTEVHAESQRLARLQHTNIVPVYSFHRRGPLQAVCMPYFGSATLADVLADLVQREGMPGSGKGLTSTLYDRQSRTLRSVESQAASASSRRRPAAGPGAPAAERPVLPAAPGGATQALQKLEGLSYVDAVLWIAARLADGLAHAHERGILHRDLKPANVLLTDDGQPMLLDFNLSEDTDPAPGAAAAMIGGTLPYMAPEHLDAFRGAPRDVDARSDLYALGVMLFELLTGRHPFQRHAGGVDEVLPAMIEERLRQPPALRPWNPRVTPAVEAIVRKCLAPHPGQRYQTARDLREDLDRQLEHRPLRHAPDRSLKERAGKFARRNPWVASATTAVAAFTFAAVLLAGLALGYKRRLEREEAVNALAGFRDEARAARRLLDGRGIDPGQGDEGRKVADKALARYGVLDPEPWQARPTFTRLPADEQRRLTAEVGELLLLVAGALPPPGGDPEAAAKEARADVVRAALRLNQAAEACFPAGQAPRALWAQRAELHGLLGEEEEARRLRLEARATPVRDGWDHYLVAREEVRRGRLPEAVKELREAIRLDPTNFSAWFLMGNCHLWGSADDFARESDALGHYTTCIALRPDFYAPYYNRGLTYQRLGKTREAEADFTRALEARPGLADAHVQRALAREALRKYPGALEDLAKAEELGAPPTRVLFLRAKVREKLGDREGAARDRAEGLKHTPEDDAGWIARGLARVGADPQGALKDFAEAAKLNPRSRHALQNQAAVLSEQLNRPREAIKLLDQLAKLYPDLVPTYSARGVLYARLGERGPAHEDARRALTRDAANGEVLYQVANVYALTSREEPGDRTEALRLLAQALAKGYGYDVLETDRDMDPLREDPRFADLAGLVKVTKALQTVAAK
jgi:serine/threonine protein kinase/tetratricopeptide (TPR) repeat protein